jgi:ubiquinone/menaquinone biosynthesis C-methylase UbiE
MKFADNEAFMDLMKKAGLTGISQVRLTQGVASIYSGIKK